MLAFVEYVMLIIFDFDVTGFLVDCAELVALVVESISVDVLYALVLVSLLEVYVTGFAEVDLLAFANIVESAVLVRVRYVTPVNCTPLVDSSVFACVVESAELLVVGYVTGGGLVVGGFCKDSVVEVEYVLVEDVYSTS